MKKLILASGSTYRKMLLERIIKDFDVVVPDYDERVLKSEIHDPEELSLKLAIGKAQSVFISYGDSVIIGSDQILIFNKKAFGKSQNYKNAFEQLKMLSGQTHQLVTSVCILDKEQKITFTQKVSLKMKNLTDQQIERYLKLDLPFDCAGSYKLEEHGISLFESIDSNDDTGIVGLPLIELSKQLAKFSYEIP